MKALSAAALAAALFAAALPVSAGMNQTALTLSAPKAGTQY